MLLCIKKYEIFKVPNLQSESLRSLTEVRLRVLCLASLSLRSTVTKSYVALLLDRSNLLVSG